MVPGLSIETISCAVDAEGHLNATVGVILKNGLGKQIASASEAFVGITDIGDFYPRIYQHKLVNALQRSLWVLQTRPHSGLNIRHERERHKHRGAANDNHECGEQQHSDNDICESKSGGCRYGSAPSNVRERAAGGTGSGESRSERDHGGSGGSHRAGGSRESKRDGSK